ncbi:MAG TPA: hypothetical protein VMW47_09845 [Verrucomicrobiae bacterium]|nr:hypothetical protein [Verrucomicrobiae bacterium]
MTPRPELAAATPDDAAPRYAAIDVGSNTVHLLVAEVVAGVWPEPLFRQRAFVQLGQDVSQRGEIGVRRRELAARALAQQVEAARRAGVCAIAIGATEALRAAANGAEVADRLAAAADQPVRILPAGDEAALAFAGATAGLPPATPTLLLDIGGASTQLAVGRVGRLEHVDSLRVGSGSVAQLAIGDPPTAAEWRAMERCVAERLPELRPVTGSVLALGTGGTITNLPRLEGPPAATTLGPVAVERILERLRREPLAELRARSGVEPERIRLCRGGILILAQLLDLLQIERLRLSERGLRDGMIAALARKGADWWREPAAAGIVGTGRG